MKNGIIIVAALVLVGIFAFVVGTRIRSRLAYYNGGFFGRPFMGRTMPSRGPRGMMGGNYRGILQGQISKIDNNNVTLQLPNGGTYTITVSDQTAVDKTVKATKADLQTGQNITVFGGSYLNGAQTVIINP